MSEDAIDNTIAEAQACVAKGDKDAAADVLLRLCQLLLIDREAMRLALQTPSEVPARC